MIRFAIADYGVADFLVEWERRHFYASDASDANATVSDSDKKQLLSKLEKVRSVCSLLELESAVRNVDHIVSRVALTTTPPRCDAVATLLHALWTTMTQELAERYCAYIPRQRAAFFEQEALLGEDVRKAFPSAQADIKDAGNCLAAELYNAAVFHCCRVAELGLRTLAKKLRIKLKHTLEYADWGTVIDAMERKLGNLKPLSRGRKKSQELEFYSNMVSDCRAIKETWRDCIMHTRKSFNEPGAMAAYSRVRDFMQRLATRVSE